MLRTQRLSSRITVRNACSTAGSMSCVLSCMSIWTSPGPPPGIGIGVGIGCGIGMPPPPEPAVVGERLTGERAYRRIAGLELIQHPRDGCRIEGGTVLDDEQKGREQRRNHGNPE